MWTCRRWRPSTRFLIMPPRAPLMHVFHNAVQASLAAPAMALSTRLAHASADAQRYLHNVPHRHPDLRPHNGLERQQISSALRKQRGGKRHRHYRRLDGYYALAVTRGVLHAPDLYCNVSGQNCIDVRRRSSPLDHRRGKHHRLHVLASTYRRCSLTPSHRG